MILCNQMSTLSQCLDEVAPLMNRYQQGEINFPDLVLQWLENAEQKMSILHLPDGSEMSSLRGRILKTADALSNVEPRPSRSAVRKKRNASAAESLQRGEAVLRNRLLAAEERLNMFEDKLCEGITAFLLQNALPEQGAPHQIWLQQTWSRLSWFQATRPLCLYLAASLSQVDRLYILDRVLGRVATLETEPPKGADVKPIINRIAP